MPSLPRLTDDARENLAMMKQMDAHIETLIASGVAESQILSGMLTVIAERILKSCRDVGLTAEVFQHHADVVTKYGPLMVKAISAPPSHG